MSFFDRNAVKVAFPDQVASGPPTSFAENMASAFSAGQATDLMISEGLMMDEARSERSAKIEEITGKPYDEALQPFMPQDDLEYYGRDAGEVQAEAVAALRASLPAEQASQILTEEGLGVRAQEIALERTIQNEDVAARAAGAGGVAGQFLGSAAAQFTDPLVAATLPFGPAASARLSVAAAINGVLAGGVTAAQQPVVQDWRGRLGLPAGVEQAVENIGMAGAGGAVLTVALGGLVKGLGADVARLSRREQVQAFDDLVKNPTPEQIVARDQIDAEARFEEANPFAPADDTVQATAQADAEHMTRGARVASAMDRDRPLPRFAEDGPEQPLVDRTADFETLADPVAAKSETDIALQGFRQQIETDGDFAFVLDDVTGPVAASRMLEDFDAEDAFLREIETCR